MHSILHLHYRSKKLLNYKSVQITDLFIYLFFCRNCARVYQLYICNGPLAIRSKASDQLIYQINQIFYQCFLFYFIFYQKEALVLIFAFMWVCQNLTCEISWLYLFYFRRLFQSDLERSIQICIVLVENRERGTKIVGEVRVTVSHALKSTHRVTGLVACGNNVFTMLTV